MFDGGDRVGHEVLCDGFWLLFGVEGNGAEEERAIFSVVKLGVV